AECEVTAHAAFLSSSFGASVTSFNYRPYAANPAPGIDLIPFPPASSSGSVYGLVNAPPVSNDVLSIAGGVPGAAMATKYADTVTNPNPKIASIYAPASMTHPSITLLDGWNIEDLR